MRNLEQSVGVHRRLVGVGKSNPGDDVGTFDLKWRHNPHAGERKVTCTVRRGVGWECLTVAVQEMKHHGERFMHRAPLYAEIVRVLPLFFFPHERPIQIHSGVEERCCTGLDFYWSERARDTILHLPEFGPNFSLTKSKQP